MNKQCDKKKSAFCLIKPKVWREEWKFMVVLRFGYAAGRQLDPEADDWSRKKPNFRMNQTTQKKSKINNLYVETGAHTAHEQSKCQKDVHCSEKIDLPALTLQIEYDVRAIAFACWSLHDTMTRVTANFNTLTQYPRNARCVRVVWDSPSYSTFYL